MKEIYDRFLDYGKPEDISEVIIGNVAQPAHAANIARVIALRSGLKRKFQLLLCIEIVLQVWKL